MSIRLRTQLAFLAATVLLVSCGGGGGRGDMESQGGFPAKQIPATISVALPAGTPVGSLVVSGGVTGTSPVKDGKATIKTWNTDRQIVGVLNGQGNPLLMGWAGNGHNRLDSTTTAAALAYFAIAGYAAPNENQNALIAAIELSPGIATVAHDIDDDIAAGRNLGSPNVSFRTDLTNLAKSLLVTHASLIEGKANPDDVTGTPTTMQSGVMVNPGTANDTIAATNSFRRRVLLFIDRDSTFDGSVPPVYSPSPESIAEAQIAPAVGTVNSGTVTGTLVGQLAQTSITPVSLPAVPTGQFGAVYDVIAIGPGGSKGSAPLLSASEAKDRDLFFKRTFLLDFVLPILNRMCISNTLLQQLGTAGQASSLANLMDREADSHPNVGATFVDTYFPNAVGQITSGDFVGASASVFSTLNSNPTTFSALVSDYSKFLSAALASSPYFTPQTTNLSSVTKWMLIALQNVDITQLGVPLPQYQGVAQSNVYETWKMTQTTGAVITLTPSASRVTTTPGKDSVTLSANVDFGAAGQPKNSTVLYSWSTPGKHGDLVFPNSTGTTSATDTPYASAQYFSDLAQIGNVGTDTVTVSVSLRLSSGTTKQLGWAASTVTVGPSGSAQNMQYSISVISGFSSLNPQDGPVYGIGGFAEFKTDPKAKSYDIYLSPTATSKTYTIQQSAINAGAPTVSFTNYDFSSGSFGTPYADTKPALYNLGGGVVGFQVYFDMPYFKAGDAAAQLPIATAKVKATDQFNQAIVKTNY
ncbi:MAG TPA: hypothetical protein VG944_20185 [Fimbriimonas sp.]|nr:hypothetical protein [Fimbriimonas sp.]